MESTQSINPINVVFFAENDEAVRTLAGRVFTNNTGDVLVDQFEGFNFRGYLRFPNSVATRVEGITDVLLVEVSSQDSENFETVRRYMDKRRTIPNKFITSPSDLLEVAQTLGAQYVNELTENLRERTLRNAINLEITLRDAFNSIDANQNGYIDAAEIAAASDKLGHSLNSEEAKEISTSLSTDGQISYQRFKQWWVQGRTDFNSFRRLLKVEKALNKYVDTTSQSFNTFVNTLQASQETQELRSRINIAPTTDFDFGMGLSLHLTVGNEFEGIAQTLSQQVRETPATVGIELRLKRAEDGHLVIQALETILKMVPQIIEAGIEPIFKHVDQSVFVELLVNGDVGDQINGILSEFNISALNFLGALDLHLTTKVNPYDYLHSDFVSILQSLFNMKFEATGNADNLHHIVNFLVQTVTKIRQGYMPSEVQMFFYFLRALTVVRKVDFNFQYDSVSAYESFRDLLVANAKFDEAAESLIKEQERSDFYFKQDSEELKPTLEQYGVLGAILALDFDQFTVFVVVPSFKVYAKAALKVKGFTDLVNHYFA